MTYLYSILTFLVTTAIGQAILYWNNRGSRVDYSVTRAVPVTIDEKTVGAYILKISTSSRKIAEDVSFHLAASGAALRIDNFSAPSGFQWNAGSEGDEIKLSIPYLKKETTSR